MMKKDSEVSFILTRILPINLESLMSNLKGRNYFANDNFTQLYLMSALSYEGHVWVKAEKKSMACSVVLKINKIYLT